MKLAATLATFIAVAAVSVEARADNCQYLLGIYNTIGDDPIFDEYERLDVADYCSKHYADVESEVERLLWYKLEIKGKMESDCRNGTVKPDGSPSDSYAVQRKRRLENTELSRKNRAELCGNSNTNKEKATSAKPKNVTPPRISEGDSRIPTLIKLKGYNGKTYVEGALKRVGKSSWEERNSQNGKKVMKFKTASFSKGQLVLFDGSRDLYLLVDLNKNRTMWKSGKKGKWNKLYAVSGVTY